jgi:hypothetical protein
MNTNNGDKLLLRHLFGYYSLRLPRWSTKKSNPGLFSPIVRTPQCGHTVWEMFLKKHPEVEFNHCVLPREFNETANRLSLEQRNIQSNAVICTSTFIPRHRLYM